MAEAKCESVRTSGPMKGTRCTNLARPGAGTCKTHAPEAVAAREAEVESRVRADLALELKAASREFAEIEGLRKSASDARASLHRIQAEVQEAEDLLAAIREVLGVERLEAKASEILADDTCGEVGLARARALAAMAASQRKRWADDDPLAILVRELCDYAEKWGHPDAAQDYRESLAEIVGGQEASNG